MGAVRSIWNRAVVVLAVAVLAMAPAIAHAASSAVSISVPVTQILEGTTSQAMAAGSELRGQLVVKSNIPWILLARLSDGAVDVAWRPAGATAWQNLEATAPVLQGPKGVHTIEYQLRVGTVRHTAASVVQIAFSLVPAR